jgi:hypothetical protein
MQVVYELAPVITEIISAHCPGTRARDEFVHACVHGEWDDATAMIEGMLAEPWHLRGYQENRLREFLELLKLDRGAVQCHSSKAEPSTTVHAMQASATVK